MQLAGLIKEHRQSPSRRSDLSFLITVDHQVTSSTSPTTKLTMYDTERHIGNYNDEGSKVGTTPWNSYNSTSHHNIAMMDVGEDEEIKFMDNYKAKLSRLKLVRQNLSSSYNTTTNHSSSESISYVNNIPGAGNHIHVHVTTASSMLTTSANMCDPHTPSPTNNNKNKNLRLLQTLRRSPNRRKGIPQRSPMMAI